MEIPGYQVLQELGRGGMATVYLAIQASFGRKVAVKVLDAKAAADHDFAERFLREAKIVAGLSHPHIVPVYDAGQHNNHYFMSMDYLAGGSLPALIKKGLNREQVIRIVQQIASALQCLHDNGYIHRDIKPDNIMFRSDGSAVLTDFGVARSQNSAEGLTQVGTVIGTPTYMCPEQINGAEIDGRADIYSLGVVLYEMLMEEPPYRSPDFLTVAVKHLQDPIPELLELHQEFQPIVDRCMAKQAEDRYASANDLILDLDKLAVGEVLPKSDYRMSNKDVDPKPVAEPSVESQEASRNMALDGNSDAGAVIQSPKIDLPEGLRFEESVRKKLGLMKRYSLLCEIVVRETHAFTIMFSRVTTKMVEWYDERSTKAEAIHLVFYIPDWNFKKAKKSVQDVYDSEGTYGFLKHLDFTVTLHEIDGNKVEAFKVN